MRMLGAMLPDQLVVQGVVGSVATPLIPVEMVEMVVLVVRALVGVVVLAPGQRGMETVGHLHQELHRG